MSAGLEPVTVNEDHDPGDAEERVLEVFEREQQTYGESRMSPGLIRERIRETGGIESKQNVNYALRQLTAAGWVRKVASGLYEFVEDPRDD